MSSKDRAPRTVVVTGDMTMEWNLGRVDTARTQGNAELRRSISVSPELGGAALLGKILSAIAIEVQKDGSIPIEVRGVPEPPSMPSPLDPRFPHSFMVWDEFKRRDGSSAWRVAERLGLDDSSSDGSTTGRWTTPSRDQQHADIVVLDDIGLGFRDHPELWPEVISTGKGPSWILLNMVGPVASGPLWQRLQSHLDRVIAVVGIDDLRQTDAQISRELSWERTAQDLLWELTFNRHVKPLAGCAYLVVSFGTAGALLLPRVSLNGPSEAARPKLFFDPAVMEDEWTDERPGDMSGYSSCLMAAIARELFIDPGDPNLDRSMQHGIGAMRQLHLNGYEPTEAGMRGPQIAFPIDRIVETLADGAPPLATAPIRDPTITLAEDPVTSEPRRWTILEEIYPEGLEQVARKIVVDGTDDVIMNVPIGRFGKLLTIDRQEIEGFRSVRSLIWAYSQSLRPERPLSIAVFGRPGSGKSFGIKQVALSMLSELIEILTFNLSQFHEPAQLLDALHQVRDSSLKGKLPLVFWDEFDASIAGQELGWLRHFLAPMQDGEFQEGQVIHHIGPAIFVFAGGTRHTLEQFSAQDSQSFIDGKGPDFVSRLKGYVNILGPDPVGDDPATDPYYVIRRAILLRMMLGSHKEIFRGRELQIDSGLLRAFLRTRSYKHGARSMESIIAMSSLDHRTSFERSGLPSEDQLALHADAHDFMGLVRSLVIEGDVMEEIAEMLHVRYCAAELEAGSSWNDADDDYLLRNPMLEQYAAGTGDRSRSDKPSLVAFDHLPEDVKEENRDFARAITNKLEAIGYEIQQARAGESATAFPREVVELLAEQEHDRWMRLKLRNGWSYSAERDERRFHHPDLVPWLDLSAQERVERYGQDHAARLGPGILGDEGKEKDRRLIEAVTSILASYGYFAQPVAR